MQRVLLTCSLLLTLLVVSPAIATADPNLPEPVGYVNDFAGVFSPDTYAGLEDALRLFEQETSVELVVVTVPDMGGLTVEDYAARLFEKWGIGKKAVDNGVLLLLAVAERKVRIEVGYGMEPYLTDGQAGRILDAEVLPDLRQGNYALGLVKGAYAVAKHIKDSGYQLGVAGPKAAEWQLPRPRWAPIWLLVALGVASLYMVSYMARTKSIWLGGVWGAVVGGVLGLTTGHVGALIGLTLGLSMLGLLVDAALSSGFRFQQSSGRDTGWWNSWGGFRGAGSGLGSRSGNHGFGGFGGGRSGGGGASRGF